MVSHDEIDQLYQVNIIQDQGLEDNIKLNISKFAEIIIILQLFQPFPVHRSPLSQYWLIKYPPIPPRSSVQGFYS